jgi:hypothetical protein
MCQFCIYIQAGTLNFLIKCQVTYCKNKVRRYKARTLDSRGKAELSVTPLSLYSPR